jgi:hypothetical protein
MFGRNLVLDEVGIHRGKSLVGWDAIDHDRYDWRDRARRCLIAPAQAARSHSSRNASVSAHAWRDAPAS